MKYSQLDVKTAIDDANDLLARGSDYEIICAFTCDRVSIQSRVKATNRLNLLLEHRTSCRA